MAKLRDKIDPFTARRLQKFVNEHRTRTGQLPTLADLTTGGFSQDVVDRAIKDKLLEQLYVTLTNGSVVKGFKNA